MKEYRNDIPYVATKTYSRYDLIMKSMLKSLTIVTSVIGSACFLAKWLIREDYWFITRYSYYIINIIVVLYIGSVLFLRPKYNIFAEKLLYSEIILFSMKVLLETWLLSMIFMFFPQFINPSIIITIITMMGIVVVAMLMKTSHDHAFKRITIIVMTIFGLVSTLFMILRFMENMQLLEIQGGLFFSPLGLILNILGLAFYIIYGITAVRSLINAQQNLVAVNTTIMAIHLYNIIIGLFFEIIKLFIRSEGRNKNNNN